MSLRCPPECEAKCCRYITIEIESPLKNKANRDEARWFLLHKNVAIMREDKTWYVQVDTDCSQLTDDHRCAVYEDRPKVCREYGPDVCDHHGEDDGKSLFVSTVEEWDRLVAKRKAKKAKKKDKKRKRKQKGKA